MRPNKSSTERGQNMSELFKNAYNRESISKVAEDIKTIYNPFKVEEFLDATVDSTWENLELKDRILKIAVTLGKYLPQNYSEALGIIDKVAMNYGNWLEGFVAFFPVFAEVYGMDEENLETSIAALGRYTKYASSELAIRPFIIKYEKRMMEQMYAWSKSESEDLRRLSCEGCRPALPWGLALNSFKKDPSPILPILEQLKKDPSLHVRKSVANNLNDISKTHPDLVVKLAKKWYGENEHTDWIVKHACRTLLKKGNRDVLAIFGFQDTTSIDVYDLKLSAKTIPIGKDITFTFLVHAKKETKVRLEYGIDYVKANGKRNRKVFQISESLYKENQKKPYTRNHSLADVSTRKHYPGTHTITLIVNGAERGTLDFELTAE